MTIPEEKVAVKPRSQSKTRSLPPVKTESTEKRTPKRKAMSSKSKFIYELVVNRDFEYPKIITSFC